MEHKSAGEYKKGFQVFYWNQEDYMAERGARASWSYTIWRPPLLVGFAVAPLLRLHLLGVQRPLHRAALADAADQALRHHAAALRVLLRGCVAAQRRLEIAPYVGAEGAEAHARVRAAAHSLSARVEQHNPRKVRLRKG